MIPVPGFGGSRAIVVEDRRRDVACRLYVLMTWTTYLREPLITPAVETLLSRLLPRIARRNGALPLALGIVTDHVPLVLRLPSKIDIPRLAQALKGATARIANGDDLANGRLRWANGYDLRSIGVRDVQRARNYVRTQKQRHGYGPVEMADADPGRAPAEARARLMRPEGH